MAAIIAVLAVVAAVVVVVLLVRGRRKDEPDADDAGPKPAGWYADPIDETQVRWWDGSAWTDHLQDKPET